MNKKIIFLLLCLITILSISTVSAIDNVTEENVDNAVTIGDTSYVVSNNSAGNENTKGNFTELQEKIKNTPSGGVCDLDKDYEFIKGESTIQIDKPMTIDGHNHTIYGFENEKSYKLKFNITSNNIVIKNMHLEKINYEYYPDIIWNGDNGCLNNIHLFNTIISLNGNHLNISKSDSWNSEIRIKGFNTTISNFNGFISIKGNNSSILNLSGGVYIVGDNATLNNINVSNNHINPSRNSFISLEGNNGKIINLTYDSNIQSSDYVRCDIYLYGNNITLLNSTFSKNKVNRYYIIYSGAKNCKIINCSFIDNVIDRSYWNDYGNLIYSTENNFEILNSIFKNNNVNTGVINLDMSNNVIICNNTFINNTAHSSGAAIRDMSANNVIILNSYFIGNSANNGGAIYLNGNTQIIINSTFKDNIAKDQGGAIYFNYGNNSFIGNSSFINNSCYRGGTVYTEHQLTVNNSVFLNNKLNEQRFHFTDNGEILNLHFHTYSYVINAVNNDVILNNVTYWGSNGIMNSGQNETIEKCGGIPIIIEFYNSKMELVKNITTTTDSNGEISIDYINLIHGKYFVKAYHLDDSYYGYYEINTTITSTLYVQDVVKYYKAEDRLIATLYDDDGNVISNAKVEFKINGQTYTRLTDKNGVASMGLNLKSGVYNVWTKYNNTQVHSTVTINPTIEANDLVKMYKNDTQFYAKFLDSNGKILANTKVQFNINGVFYHKTTDENGVAKMGIQLRPGHYILTAINPVNGEQRGFNIIVKSLIESNDLTKYYLNESRFQATIYSKDGSLATNKEVTFNINGVFYHKTTDENGVASLGINLRPGSYIITTIVDGLEIGKYVTVLPTVLTNDLDMKFQDGSKFRATILNGQGIPLFNQNVTFNVNGVFYNKITDGDGIASLTINLLQGKYIITTIWDEYQVGNNITIS